MVYTHSSWFLGEAASPRAKGVYINIHDFGSRAQPTKPKNQMRRVL